VEGVAFVSLVTDQLQRQGVPFEVIPHPRAMTSVDEAGALGIVVDEVVKTLVLDAASGHALAVLPATRRLDTKVAQQAVGDRHARLASEDELTRDFAGFELGGLPPLGSLLAIPVFVDPDVMARETSCSPREARPSQSEFEPPISSTANRSPSWP